MNNHKKLEKLRLTANQITKIKGLENLINLKSLDFENNKISEIMGFETLTNLEELKLSGNPINNKEFFLLSKNPSEVVTYCQEKARKIFIFMLMPFKPKKLTKIYKNYIKNPLEEHGFMVKRADDFFKSVPIFDDIIKSISDADIIIADLTKRNPNVYYELGRAHEKNKNVILICQKKEKIPFDIKYIRTIIYEDSKKGYKYLQEGILKYIETYLKEHQDLI